MQYKIDIIVKLNKLTQSLIFKNNDIIIILYLIVLFVY